MKTLLINGSPRKNGNTHLALTEVARTLKAEGIETEIFWLGNKPVRGCTACYACVSKNLGKCIFDDDCATGFRLILPRRTHLSLGLRPISDSLRGLCSQSFNGPFSQHGRM